MAKKIKFPLEMKDGKQVRNIDELRLYFDIEKVMEYFVDGKLFTWLQDRYYIQEAEEVSRLDTSSSDVKEKLCDILGVELETQTEPIDIEKIKRRKVNLSKLKKYTDDEEIWEKAEYVAFNQEELADLLDEGCKTIYLCGSKFQVPYSLEGNTYIGINEPEVYINAVGNIDLDVQGIKFYKVKILNQNIETGDELLQLGLEYLWERNGKEYDKEKAIKYFQMAAQKGQSDAMAYLVKRLTDVDGNGKNNITNDEAVKLLDRSVELGSSYGIGLKGIALYLGMYYKQNQEEGKNLIIKSFNLKMPAHISSRFNIIPAGKNEREEEFEVLKKGIEMKSSWAANRLGVWYYNGNEIVPEDKKKAHEYFMLAIEFDKNGYPEDGWEYRNAGVNFINGTGTSQDIEKGIEYLKKACCQRFANAGDAAGDAALQLAYVYCDNAKGKKNIKEAYEYAEQGRKWNNKGAAFLAGKLQCEEESIKNIKEGSKKLIEGVQEDVSYAKTLLQKKLEEEVIAAQIAEGGFYYIIKLIPRESLSVDRKIAFCFSSFENVYKNNIEKKIIFGWSSTLTPKAKMQYCKGKVYVALQGFEIGLFVVINTENQKEIYRNQFQGNGMMGEVQLEVNQNGEDVKVKYGNSAFQLQSYNA